MGEHEAGSVVEVARAADQCTSAVRAAAYGELDEVFRQSPYRAELVALWARLLVTITPEDLAAEMVDELWRHGTSEWLAAIEHFLDYAHDRGPESLERFVTEVVSWPWALQLPFARIVLTTVAKSLPDGILPSHYLVARGMVIEAADRVGSPGLTSALTGLIAQCWRHAGFPAMRLAFDLARHVDRELPDRRSRRQAIAALALVAGEGRSAEQVTVTLRRDGRVLTEHDDPAREAGCTEKAAVVAARVVRYAASGAVEKIETELTDQMRGENELVSVLLALTLAAAAHVRDEVLPGLG
ncbi:MAG TPA: hypothetical protein VHC18_14720 [Amycolatopsis sp.]|nr:hypothetical protein [Amycolatopsis sp.]